MQFTMQALSLPLPLPMLSRSVIKASMADPLSQSDKFKAAARELECDEDEARWDERLRKVAKGKPEPEKPE